MGYLPSRISAKKFLVITKKKYPIPLFFLIKILCILSALGTKDPKPIEEIISQIEGPIHIIHLSSEIQVGKFITE